MEGRSPDDFNEHFQKQKEDDYDLDEESVVEEESFITADRIADNVASASVQSHQNCCLTTFYADCPKNHPNVVNHPQPVYKGCCKTRVRAVQVVNTTCEMKRVVSIHYHGRNLTA